MNDSNPSSEEDYQEEQKDTGFGNLVGISFPGTQPSNLRTGENYIDMPSLAKIVNLSDDEMTWLLCNVPNSPYYGVPPETLENELHPNAMRRMLNTLAIINDMDKSAFDRISEARSIDEQSELFKAADQIELKMMLINSLPNNEKNDKLLANQKRISNKSCPRIWHVEQNERNSSSIQEQLHEGSLPCDISDLDSSMPVWIEDEDADCIANCDERSADIYEDSVHLENISEFRAQAVAFLERHLV